MKAKKLISLLLAVMVALTMVSTVSFADSASATVAYSIDAVDNTISAKTGSSIAVPWKVTSNEDITAFGCIITYDKDLLTYVDFENTAELSTRPMNSFNVVNDAAAGTLNVTAFDQFGTFDGVIFTFNFTVASEINGDSATANLDLAYLYQSTTADDFMEIPETSQSFTDAVVEIVPPHTAPTFEVAINNNAPVSGDTLTATVSNFQDNWGLTPEYAYQWLANGAAIAGATGETYEVKADDFEKAISVKVTATVASDDDATNTKEVTSAATAAVDVPDIAPVLTVAETRDDTVAVGTAIAANASATIDAKVGGTNTITYSWKVDGVEVGTAASYTIATEDYVDGDEMLTCDVTVTNDRNELTDTATITFTNAIVAGNMPPVVSNMALSNVAADKAIVGATVEASYTFTDVADAANTPEDLDGGVIVEWYIGEEKIAEGTSLVIDKKWIGETVDVYFAPWSNDNTPNEILGYEEDELLAGAVEVLSFTVEPDLNTAPVVSEVVVLGGAIYLEKEFTVNYKYVDINGFAPNCTIALYKAADDSAVDGAAYTVNGNKVTVTDASLVDTALYVKVTPGNPEGYTYVAQLVGADSADLTLGDKPKASTGGGGITGPMLGGGGSSAPTTTPAPSTEPTTEPTTTPEPTTPVEAPVPAAKDCISLVIDDKTINAYGEAYEADVAPYIVEDRTVLPVRAICELLGAKVEWIEATRSVVLRFEGRIVELSIDSKIAKIDGQEVELNIAPFITSDRTFLGLRDMAEAINMNVEWHNSVRTVSITAK